jgi:hypothetical protein
MKSRPLVRNQTRFENSKLGSILALSAATLVLVFAFTAFVIDVGYITILKTELQATADAAALGSIVDLTEGNAAVIDSAVEIAGTNVVNNKSAVLARSDVELGTFNLQTRIFQPNVSAPNAVRVTAKLTDHPLFFAPVVNHNAVSLSQSAIAMLNPRDIVFVVDLSGSMNDDTEPCWATRDINNRFADTNPGIGDDLMQAVYDDFDFGTFPGVVEHIGEPLNVPQNDYSFPEMTKDDGALTCSTIDAKYRILNTDNELTRRVKGYSWIIDKQIARLMPDVRPEPSSDTQYAYWERYIDYLVTSRFVGDDPNNPVDPGGGGGGGGGGPAPPADGNIVPLPDELLSIKALIDGNIVANEVDANEADPGCGVLPYTIGLPRRGAREWLYVPDNPSFRIFWYNNPNKATFPEAPWDLVDAYNKIGFRTYVQFMMDLGEDRSPNRHGPADPNWGDKTPMSLRNAQPYLHSESTAGGTFDFPVREQPMHAVRRSLIAALEVVRKMNNGVPAGVGDRVALVTFDFVDSYHQPRLVTSLTGDYKKVMEDCAKLQEFNDSGRSTASEYGVALARDHLELPADGGQGRLTSKKVIVLLSDGVPNVWFSNAGDVNVEAAKNPSPDYYSSDLEWYNAVLMQASKFKHDDNGILFSVGMGLGADLDFMDRVARIAKTADADGLSPRGTGNPADYEQRLTEIFRKIIERPGSRLVR